ncbi:hypothetical protein WS105_0150 [Weissella ceti]|uniref:Uncharacterized protein n=3 Tax=Weissella TaxID=46255 RepID=A0A075TU90_9LACO|nr:MULTISPECIES: hypothetical protein [Weissella]AIM62403.1 hypothetical protein WS74_0151 [Weissella ceti]AIG65089.1 hypothetical protein WS08_0150 [Weissella tructae]AIM63740.1 hypothetical protein WS105_0150 [Weissella ceti]ELA07928.1 hypothetical protein WCNC_00500 [Weissella ceti NC36]QVV91486.1 hypothetical protein KHQ32_00885 [Weissella tructae]
MTLTTSDIKSAALLMNSIDTESFFDSITEISSSNDYWLVRTEGGALYTDFKTNGYVGIGWNELNVDTIQNSDVPTLKERLKQIDKEKLKLAEANELEELLSPEEIDEGALLNSERSYTAAANQLHTFVNKIAIGDFVLIPNTGSKKFSLGKVISGAIEDSESVAHKDDNPSFVHSDFIKRHKVQWLGEFNRDDADSSFYKMIYTHRTISNITEYQSVINRAVFDIYILDDSVHLTFHVTEPGAVNMKSMGAFAYNIPGMVELVCPEDIVSMKSNVQSPGPIETIIPSKKAAATVLIALTFAGGVSALTYGGELEVGNMSFKVPGVLTQQTANDKVSAETKAAELQNTETENKQTLDVLNNSEQIIEKAIALGADIEDLGLKYPKETLRLLQKQLDQKKDVEEAKASTTSDK